MRYFESYYNADKMVEVSADAARTLDSYVVEEAGPMRRYRRFIDNELDTIIYRGWDDPTEPLADLSRLAAKVPAQIHSPVEQLADDADLRPRLAAQEVRPQLFLERPARVVAGGLAGDGEARPHQLARGVAAQADQEVLGLAARPPVLATRARELHPEVGLGAAGLAGAAAQ